MKDRRGDAKKRRPGDKKSRRASASSRRGKPLITLLTDFGTADYFVAAVKGVILSGNPKARIVDLSHDIPPQDIEAAAFTLLAAHTSFPAGTIHLVVVDPGVGSSRKPLLIKSGKQFFIGPDNGVLSHVCGPDAQIFELTKAEYFREPVSPTFEGRDVFAPVAAALSTGIKPEKLGQMVGESIRLPGLELKKSDGKQLEGRIIHIDHFGNCVTNITSRDLSEDDISAGATLQVGKKTVNVFKTFFEQPPQRANGVFGIWGSAGFLEVAVQNKSAAKLLSVHRGDPVFLEKM